MGNKKTGCFHDRSFEHIWILKLSKTIVILGIKYPELSVLLSVLPHIPVALH
jgi:hypothetical protein